MTGSGTSSGTSSFGGIASALQDLVNAEMDLGRDFIESLTGITVPSTADLTRALRGRMSRSGSCCHIPPPCWMPRSLGQCTSHVSRCDSACIRLVITNCDRVERSFSVNARDQTGGTFTVSPPSLTLAPFRKGTVSVCVAVPADAPPGDHPHTMLWVHGCREYYLDWVVSVGTIGADSCHEVEISDCPDYVHHWYDHFYCARPCPPQPVAAGAGG
jgi:hypothetical protein